jgi:hypothetical protein
MGIKRYNKMCNIKSKYMEFNITILFNRMHFEQVSLLI